MCVYVYNELKDGLKIHSPVLKKITEYPWAEGEIETAIILYLEFNIMKIYVT